MIKDSEIKSDISPFRSIDGEKKVYDGYDGYASINQIISKIERNHFGDLEYDILNIVNKFKFVTSRQITQLLKLQGVEFTGKKKLPRKLEQMLKTKLLNRCYFSTLDEKSAYKVYSLDKNGKYLLEAREIPCDWKTTDNIRPSLSIKKRLATNQMMIAHMEKTGTYEASETEYEINSKKYNRKLIVKGLLKFKDNRNNQRLNIMIEALRRTNDKIEQEDDISRLKIYNEYVETTAKTQNIYVVLLCEDKRHMAEIFKVMLLNNISPNNIYFTYDLAQLESDLSRTLYYFNINDDKGIDLENTLVDIWN